MRYQGIIFDLDGVLCYSDQYHYQAWKMLADELEIEFNPKMNEKLRGVSRMDSLNLILSKSNHIYSQAEKEALAEKKNKYYLKFIQSMSRNDLADEAIETLEELHRIGAKVAIGSSSKNAKIILKQLEITSYFDAISDGKSIHKSKPDPEVFWKAAEKLNLASQNCLVIEDAMSGIEAAYRGKFDSTAIGDAQNHPNATYHIKKLSELIQIVK